MNTDFQSVTPRPTESHTAPTDYNNNGTTTTIGEQAVLLDGCQVKKAAPQKRRGFLKETASLCNRGKRRLKNNISAARKAFNELFGITPTSHTSPK